MNGEPVSRGLSIVIKDSSQVKSATDNIGTFDRSNRDIRYSKKDKPAVSAYTERYDTFSPLAKMSQTREKIRRT